MSQVIFYHSTQRNIPENLNSSIKQRQETKTRLIVFLTVFKFYFQDFTSPRRLPSCEVRRRIGE